VDADWATARTLRVAANNLFGRQCSDMSTTVTARTRNREKVSTRPLRIRKSATNPTLNQ
jgi:hypothetical protein